MKRIIAFFCLLFCGFVESAIAEEIPEEFSRLYLYPFAGIMLNPNRLMRGHYGAGGEFRISKNISLDGEVSYFPFSKSEKVLDVAVRLSIGAEYHFVAHGSYNKLDPFVSGGIAWRLNYDANDGPNWRVNGVNHMIYFGGGVNYWFSPRFGLKLEFLDHMWPTNGTTLHYMDTRVGACFGI
jgi:hypothetical protein